MLKALAALALDPQALRTMPVPVLALKQQTRAYDAYLKGDLLGSWEVCAEGEGAARWQSGAWAFNNPFGMAYYPRADHYERTIGCTSVDTFDVTVSNANGSRTRLKGASVDATVAAFRTLPRAPT